MFLQQHPNVDINPRRPPPSDRRYYANGCWVVNFYHQKYKQYGKYPFGILTMIAYWAETQIFGGLLLFDRGESGLEVGQIRHG